MKLKSLIALPATILAVALTLGTPLTAQAVVTPDGSTPYGKNTICDFHGDFGLADPTDTTCSTIPTFNWNAGEPTTPTNTGNYAVVETGSLDYVSAVVSEGTLQGGEEGGYSDLFYVEPTDPTKLPFLATTTITVNNPNSDNFTVQGVTAQFVADNSVTAGLQNAPSGEKHNLVQDGYTSPVDVQRADATKFDAEIALPSPTWEWTTNGTLNGYGWSGYLDTTVTVYMDGQFYTYTDRVAVDATAGWMYDITNFVVEEPTDPGSIGVSSTVYAFTLSTRQLGIPVTPGTTPEPEDCVEAPAPGGKSVYQVIGSLLNPCDPETPTEETPAPATPTTPAPEPTNPGLTIETGDRDGVNFALLGVAGVLVAGAGVVIFARRGRNADQ